MEPPLKIILSNILTINTVKGKGYYRESTIFSSQMFFNFRSFILKFSGGCIRFPIKVDANGEQLRAGTVSFPVWRYTITSIDNEVIIKSLVLNRGNCVISTADRGENVNKRLGFGQSYTFTSPTNKSFSQCRPLELVVSTNKGSFTFSWW